MSIPIRKFTDILRKNGFVQTYHYRGTRDNSGTRVFTKKIDERRTLDLQLWGDGEHRVSHYIDGCMDTKPTDFTTPEEMLVAIEKETIRTDNGWFATGHKNFIDDKPIMVLI